jgi:hypothetical protein
VIEWAKGCHDGIDRRVIRQLILLPDGIAKNSAGIECGRRRIKIMQAVREQHQESQDNKTRQRSSHALRTICRSEHNLFADVTYYHLSGPSDQTTNLVASPGGRRLRSRPVLRTG